jgi:hypothetical protein
MSATIPTWDTVEALITAAKASADALTGQFLQDDAGNVLITQGAQGDTPLLVETSIGLQSVLSSASALAADITAIQTAFDALRASLQAGV